MNWYNVTVYHKRGRPNNDNASYSDTSITWTLLSILLLAYKYLLRGWINQRTLWTRNNTHKSWTWEDTRNCSSQVRWDDNNIRLRVFNTTTVTIDKHCSINRAAISQITETSSTTQFHTTQNKRLSMELQMTRGNDFNKIEIIINRLNSFVLYSYAYFTILYQPLFDLVSCPANC